MICYENFRIVELQSFHLGHKLHLACRECIKHYLDSVIPNLRASLKLHQNGQKFFSLRFVISARIRARQKLLVQFIVTPVTTFLDVAHDRDQNHICTLLIFY